MTCSRRGSNLQPLLTLNFWQNFARCLGCEDPERTITIRKERMRSIGHIGSILATIVMTVLAAGNSRIGRVCRVAGIVALCVIIIATFSQIARAREVSAILGREQEPFLDNDGGGALSNAFGHSAARVKIMVEGPDCLRLCQAHRRVRSFGRCPED